MQGNRDRVAALEMRLGLERARVRELKARVADLAERLLEMHWTKEQLEAELREQKK